MNNFINTLIEGSYGWISTTILLVVIIYYVFNLIYDLLSKTDIEKSLTYRGKDRTLSGIVMFALYFLIVVILSFDSFQKIIKENNIWVALLSAFIVTLLFYIIIIALIFIIYLIFTWRGWIPRYEVKLDKEYWLILKVTQDKRVILKNKDEYLTLSNVGELDNKIIRKYKEVKQKKRFN